MSRNPIQDNFVILCSKLNLEKILPYLKQERMVTTDEYEILTNPNFTKRQKREKLLIWLPRKGRNYFTNFGKCLVWSGQTELARHIGVDVALVPDPPFELPQDEPSPQEHQQQMMSLIRSMMATTQQPPPPAVPKSTSHLPHPDSGPPPAHAHDISSGGSSVPLAPGAVHQATTNSRVHFLLPQSSSGPNHHPIQAASHYTLQPSSSAQQPEPMELSGGSAAPPQHLRPDRHVLRASTANEEVSDPAQKKGKVFVLYCKDDAPNLFSEDALALADTLNLCGGITCFIDHYINSHPSNWNAWTQEMIEESEYVLLVWSPGLAKMIKTPGEYMLNMEKGKYYANGVVNLIHPPKFIPVFLNGYNPGMSAHLEWLPPQLRTYTIYNLNISELHSVLEVPDGTLQHVFSEKLQAALHDDRFREVAKLVNHLRGTSGTAPPVPPQNPITVPSSVHNPVPVAHPHSEVHSLVHVVYPHQSGGRSQVCVPPPSGVKDEQSIHYVMEAVQPASAAWYPQSIPPGSVNLMHSQEHQSYYQAESGHFVQPVQQVEGLEPEHIPDAKLRQIAIRLKEEWWRLGVKLGVETSELDAVENALNKPTNYEDAMWNMLRLWQRKKKELATKDALKQALLDIGKARLAREIFPDD